MRRIDSSNQTIGGWFVGESVTKNKKIYYRCTCLECKKEKVIYGCILRKKPPICECKGRMTNKDIIGQQFGLLTIVEKVVIDRRTYCKCQCQCGGTKLVVYNHLTSGTIKTCGCRRLVKDNLKKSLEKYCTDGTYIPGITRKNKNKNNTSGYPGVSYRKDRNKYRAYIKYQRKHIHLGNFDNIEDAIRARKLAEEKYFGKILDKINTETVHN